jgi:putative membrane protein
VLLGRRKRKRLVRGTLAGIAGGLAASWVINVFMSQLGGKITEQLMTDEERANQQKKAESSGEQQSSEDATMKTAEAVVHTVTHGRHLSHEGKRQGGPIVHYTFGALMGLIYGALTESTEWTSAGFGTAFGVVLFAAADLAAVPALKLGPSPADQPLAQQATPFAAHLVYGVTTDLVRRAILAAA